MPPKKDQDATAFQKGLRLFSLLLFSRRAWSLTELAAELECSKQTILRLAAQLESSTWAKLIEEERGNRKFYRLARPAQPVQATLNPQKLAELTLCRDFLARLLPPKIRGSLADSLLINENLLPEGEAPPPSIGLALTKGRIDYAPFEAQLRNMLRAIYGGWACRVTYRKDLRRPPEEFIFAPKKILAFRETVYLAGWRVEKKRRLEPLYEVTLALQRTLAAELTRYATLNIPEPREPADGTFGLMQGEPFRLTARFSPALATYVAERQWSEDQSLKWHKDGALTISLTSRNGPEALAWLMGFGPGARLLAPAWLAAELRDKLAEAAAQYDKHRPTVKRI